MMGLTGSMHWYIDSLGMKSSHVYWNSSDHSHTIFEYINCVLDILHDGMQNLLNAKTVPQHSELVMWF